ncbi:hypothetical protein Poly41_00800 [Novipirellula artificiosorum]|uniref:Uncharacterized protein n=2 Tax=Novipirellula artificiosorum TaxID=2528016 RepID=A0A5C6DYS0_9BACT|nr:hypothetical protein Poly41_00800 [Novipirellula artificiosorum]
MVVLLLVAVLLGLVSSDLVMSTVVRLGADSLSAQPHSPALETVDRSSSHATPSEQSVSAINSTSNATAKRIESARPHSELVSGSQASDGVAPSRPDETLPPLPAIKPNSSRTLASSRLPHPDSLQQWPGTALEPSLPYTSTTEFKSTCRRLLNQAAHEYRVGAWLSAETSAWSALAYSTEAIQISLRENRQHRGYDVQQRMHASADPVALLQSARTAMFEARDFDQQLNAENPLRIQTVVRSHRSKIFTDVDLQTVSAVQAVEAYLEHARQTFGSLASENWQAAEAMDLLATIYLARNDPATLPSGTALCLRRAALQGQPSNADLASRLGMQLAQVGLFDEARRVLQHSLSIRPDRNTQVSLAGVLRSTGYDQQAAMLESAIAQSNAMNPSSVESVRIPDVVQLSPEEFASISRPIVPEMSSSSDSQVTGRTTARPQAALASARLTQTASIAVASQRQAVTEESSHEATVDEEEPILKHSPIRRTLQSMRKWW